MCIRDRCGATRLPFWGGGVPVFVQPGDRRYKTFSNNKFVDLSMSVSAAIFGRHCQTARAISRRSLGFVALLPYRSVPDSLSPNQQAALTSDSLLGQFSTRLDGRLTFWDFPVSDLQNGIKWFSSKGIFKLKCIQPDAKVRMHVVRSDVCVLSLIHI